MVNFDNSIFMGSKNVKEKEKDELSKIIGVSHSSDLGFYLGIPSQNAKNSANFFWKIKDKVGKVLQSWKEKLFSAGGKEVLIKAIT